MSVVPVGSMLRRVGAVLIVSLALPSLLTSAQAAGEVEPPNSTVTDVHSVTAGDPEPLNSSTSTALSAAAEGGSSARPVDAARSLAIVSSARTTTVTVVPGNPMANELVTFNSVVRGAGRPVVLQRRSGTRWIAIKKGTSLSRGRVQLAARLPGTSTVRVVAPRARVGSRTYRSYVGPISRIGVVKQSAALTMDANVFVGEKTTASGRFYPARLNRAVRLEKKQGTSWVQVAMTTTNSLGYATFSLYGKEPGSNTFRAVAAPYKGARAHATVARTSTVLPSTVTVSDDVKVLTDGEVANLVDGTTPNGSTLKFGAGSDRPELKSGNVLSLLPNDQTPNGALVRVVDSTVNSDGSLTATTDPAALPDLIENIPPDFDQFPVDVLSTEIGDVPDGVEVLGGGTTGAATLDGQTTAAARTDSDPTMAFGVVSVPQVRFSYRHELSTPENTYSISGHMYVRPGVQIELHAKLFQPQDWKIGVVADYDIGVNADFSTSLADKAFKFPLPKIRSLLVAFIGPVPVVITSELGPEVSAHLEGKVGIETSYSVVSDRSFGFEMFRGSTRFYTEGGEQVVAQAPRPYAQGKLTVFGGVYGNIYAYGLAGPYFKAGYEATAEVKQALGDPLAYCVHRGPVAEMGVETSDLLKKFFGYGYRFTHGWDFAGTDVAGLCDGSKPPLISTSALPRGLTNIAYYKKLAVDNGSAPFTWSAAGLPPGLSITGDAITGTPSQVGSYNPSITVVDKFGRTTSRTLSLSIVAPNPGSAELLGKIARLDDARSWYVDKRGGKHPIRDGGTYQCLVAQGVGVVQTVLAAVTDLPQYEDAKCVTANPGDIISTSDGDAYLINANWTRSWIPDGGSYLCLTANGHTPRNDVPRYYVDDLTQAANATMSCYDANAVKGKVVRSSDATSWYIDKRGGKHWIPDGGTYECIAAQTGGAYAHTVPSAWLTQQQYEDAGCIRANPGDVIRTSDGDAYLINANWTRSWIPDGGSFLCLTANGHELRNDVPRYYVDDLVQAADVTSSCYDSNAVKGKVVRGSDAKSWYIDKRGGKHWIPDGGTYDCIVAQTGGAYANVVPASFLTQPQYENAQCVRAAPGNIIRHLDGDAYLVNESWTRSWIQTAGSYACYRAQGRTVVNGVPRYYIDDLASAGTATFPSGNCIVRRPNGTAFFLNNEGKREWIADTPTWDCEVGRSVPVINASDGLVDSFSEVGWHYCLNMANLQNKIVRNADTGAAWLTYGNNTKTWIPDEFTYNCRTAQGYQVANVRWQQYIDAFSGGTWDSCFNLDTFKNKLVKWEPEGDVYFIDSAGIKHWVPGDRYSCMVARYGQPHIAKRRNYFDSIASGDWGVCGDTLYPGQNMDRGQSLRSSNGYTLIMQYDGNLVIYNPSGSAVWATSTGSNARKLRFDSNGAVSVQDGSGNWLRSLCNSYGSNATHLVMQTDGNLVLYRGSTPIWARYSSGLC